MKKSHILPWKYLNKDKINEMRKNKSYYDSVR